MGSLERIAKEWTEAFNAHDEDRLRALTAAKAVLYAPGDVHLEGRDAVIDYAMAWLNAFPDGKITVERQLVAGDWLVQQYTFRGTHSETLPAPTGEIPATGRRLEGRVADLTRIEDGAMVETHLYFDQLDVMAQLGLTPELARA
jgi:predicted ester cyclase